LEKRSMNEPHCPHCKIVVGVVCACIAIGGAVPPHHEAVFPNIRLYAAEPPHTPHRDAPQRLPNLVAQVVTSTISNGTFYFVPPTGS
jgi:hypothetical protein